MATVIQGQGVTPNAIGRGFGTGLSQGVTQLLQDQAAKKKQTEQLGMLAPILQQNAGQFGGDQTATALAQLLSQVENPGAIANFLSQNIKSQDTINSEKELKQLQQDKLISEINKNKSTASNLDAKTEELKTRKPKEDKKVQGTINNRIVFDTPDNIISKGGTVGNPSVFQKQIQRMINANKDRADFLTNEGGLKDNIASYAALTTGSGQDIALNRMRSRHYPDSVIENDSGDILPNPNAPKDLTKLSSAAERIFQKARIKLFSNKDINANSIPDSDGLMAQVVNHLSSLEEKIRDSKPGQKSALTNEDKALLRLAPTSIKSATDSFLKNLLTGATKTPLVEGESKGILDSANRAATPKEDNSVRLKDEDKQFLYGEMIKEGFVDYNSAFKGLKEAGFPDVQAKALAEEYLQRIQQAQGINQNIKLAQ